MFTPVTTQLAAILIAVDTPTEVQWEPNTASFKHTLSNFNLLPMTQLPLLLTVHFSHR